MTFDPLYILGPLWIGWVAQAFLSALLAWKLNRIYKQPGREAFDTFRPPATVVVPFRGVDSELAAAVRSFCEQDYPDYKLLLLVDSIHDPAYKVLEQEAMRYPGKRIEIIVAGAASMNEGQKVHNQLHALALLEERCTDDEAWVFADSDAQVKPDWLGKLVGPLIQTNVTGVVTGYRWLIPKKGNGSGFWTQMGSIVNSSIACLYARAKWVRAWGGSMAILAGTARRIGLRRYLEGALTDDFQFSKACLDADLRVYFVPQCLVASSATFSRSSFFNFTHRQYLITRVYALPLYIWALGLTTLYTASFISAWTYLIVAALHDYETWRPGIAIGAMVLVFLLNVWRSNRRSVLIRRAFGKDVRRKMRVTMFLDRFFTWLWMGIHWIAVASSLLSSSMEWRGIFYRIYGPQDVRRMNRA